VVPSSLVGTLFCNHQRTLTMAKFALLTAFLASMALANPMMYRRQAVSSATEALGSLAPSAPSAPMPASSIPSASGAAPSASSSAPSYPGYPCAQGDLTYTIGIAAFPDVDYQSALNIMFVLSKMTSWPHLTFRVGITGSAPYPSLSSLLLASTRLATYELWTLAGEFAAFRKRGIE
jgi:hypothetical protein